jgi:hypothetical protein
MVFPLLPSGRIFKIFHDVLGCYIIFILQDCVTTYGMLEVGEESKFRHPSVCVLCVCVCVCVCEMCG